MNNYKLTLKSPPQTGRDDLRPRTSIFFWFFSVFRFRKTERGEPDQRGFTLVELMVVLVILGVVTIGAITSITSQDKVYHSEEENIDMQMNARIAMQRITDVIRVAGFGCKDSFGVKYISGNIPTKGDVAPNPLTSLMLITNNTPPTSDVLTLAAASRFAGTVTAVPASNQITLDKIEANLKKSSESPEKSLIFVSPRERNVFQSITNIETNTLTTFESPGYNVGDIVYQVQAFTVSLSDSSQFRTFNPSIRSLRIDENVDTSSTQLDVADNIHSLQFQYGIDNNNDQQVDNWVDDPAAQIHQIKAVKVFLLMVTGRSDREYTDRRSYVIAGVTVGPFNDHFHRQLYETTVYIRNLNL